VTGRDYDHAWLAARAGVTLGHVAGALLVSWQDEVKVFGLINGIENGKNGATWVADCTTY
jgi:hypothetical protein